MSGRLLLLLLPLLPLLQGTLTHMAPELLLQGFASNAVRHTPMRHSEPSCGITPTFLLVLLLLVLVLLLLLLLLQLLQGTLTHMVPELLLQGGTNNAVCHTRMRHLKLSCRCANTFLLLLLLQGTLTHMAPELVLQGHASKARDVYAFGILL
jgi:serine/threonine protein kinase